jgi:hypothetical protein
MNRQRRPARRRRRFSSTTASTIARSSFSSITVPAGFSGLFRHSMRASPRYGSSCSSVGMNPSSARVGITIGSAALSHV